ncbi:MAG: GNAT family N-acetyltransferase [Firmicutes bacterium]|nr:GNAT family N-acetyltransferase [Bacillota bacterium]
MKRAPNLLRSGKQTVQKRRESKRQGGSSSIALPPVSFVVRPYATGRDNARVARCHSELLLRQQQLWHKLSGLTDDPQEPKRSSETTREAANWVRQLGMMIGRGDAVVLLLDGPAGESAAYALVTDTVDPLAMERTGIVGELYVEPEWRGKGAGQQMLQAAERWLRARGVRSVQVFVTRTNADAVDLYTRAGYVTYDYRMVKTLST